MWKNGDWWIPSKDMWPLFIKKIFNDSFNGSSLNFFRCWSKFSRFKLSRSLIESLDEVCNKEQIFVAETSGTLGHTAQDSNPVQIGNRIMLSNKSWCRSYKLGKLFWRSGTGTLTLCTIFRRPSVARNWSRWGWTSHADTLKFNIEIETSRKVKDGVELQ